MTATTNIPRSLTKNGRTPDEGGHGERVLPVTEEPDLELLTRERLIARWRHGSDPFFWRTERAGALIPYRSGGLQRYAWSDVFAFEGGAPPEGLEAAYRRDLLTPQEVRFCACSSDWLMRRVRAGELPVRRIGRAHRFVAAEVADWQARRWSRGR